MIRLNADVHSRTGAHHAVNQDAYLIAPENGVWALSDGMGGHAAGELASAAVCEILGDIPLHAQLHAQEAAVREAVSYIDERLRQRARQLGDICGATLVALLQAEDGAAVLWAGDSRAYHWRDNKFMRLTRDHTPEEEMGVRVAADLRSKMILRAIGAESPVALERADLAIVPGDRLLLCCDGVTDALDDAALARLLVEGDAEAMTTAAATAGSTDDITALILQAF